LNICVYRRPA